jgi:hypothetical protein
MNSYKVVHPEQGTYKHTQTQETVAYNKYDNGYQQHSEYPQDGQAAGIICLVVFISIFILAVCWPKITDWFKSWWYRNYTIESFIICQKSPELDMKKIYQTVDDTNAFLRGKEMRGLKTKRKKIKTKNLISVTSAPGEGCYYFIIWYKGRQRHGNCG